MLGVFLIAIDARNRKQKGGEGRRRLLNVYARPESHYLSLSDFASDYMQPAEQEPEVKRERAGGRKLLHSNSGASWVKRDLDAALIMAGDGQTGMYEASTKAMSLRLYGTPPSYVITRPFLHGKENYMCFAIAPT